MSNVDDAEIRKFAALAARWWDPESDFKPLHRMNPVRADYINTHSSVQGKKLLDVGCGGGILTEAMARLGPAQVTGIDMGEAPLAVARLHAAESNLKIDYRQATAEDLAAREPNSYDIVCCLEMLEHVPDPASVIRACAELARPGAHLYFSTINRNPKAFVMAIVGAEYVLGLLPKGTHDYKKLIKPSELAAWLRAAGLELEHMTGILMNPLTSEFRLKDNDLDVNYLVRARKPLVD